MKDKDSYLEQLKKPTPGNLEVESLQEYMNAVTAINEMYGRAYYRGQASKDWKIESSARRVSGNNTQKQLREYHRKLLRDAQKMEEVDHTELRLLAHLQHHGAKTILIDYTRNPFAAIWFACLIHNDTEDKNAAVYCFTRLNQKVIRVEENSPVDELFGKSEDYYEFHPPYINRRIISQQGLFLFRAEGKNPEEDHIVILIPKGKKKEILRQLNLFGISQKTMFPDFHGFLEWYGEDKFERRLEEYETLLMEAKQLLSDYKSAEASECYRQAEEIAIELLGENDE